jgi:hypothetical protein
MSVITDSTAPAMSSMARSPGLPRRPGKSIARTRSGLYGRQFAYRQVPAVGGVFSTMYEDQCRQCHQPAGNGRDRPQDNKAALAWQA